MVQHDPQDAVAARLAWLEAEVVRLGGRPHRPPRRRRGLRRLLPIVGVMSMVLLLPLAVSASHQWTDVPDSHTFHGDIDWLTDARITAGCGASTFCPDQNVTRGQMAAFLRRGLSAVEEDHQANTIVLDGTEKTIVSVTVQAGTQTGGTAYVLVTVTAVARTTSDTGCPCRAEFAGGGVTRNIHVPEVLESFAQAEGTMTWVQTIPTGVATVISVTAEKTVGTGTVYAGGSMTAITAYSN